MKIGIDPNASERSTWITSFKPHAANRIARGKCQNCLRHDFPLFEARRDKARDVKSHAECAVLLLEI